MSRDHTQHGMPWIQERALANTVMCPECHQPAGEDCTNLATGRPLGGQPAHFRRSRAAATSATLPPHNLDTHPTTPGDDQ